MLNWSNRIKNEIKEIENKNNIDVFYFPTTIDFRVIDGHINFTIVVINYILKYGKRNAETNRQLRKISGRLSKISREVVLYEEGTDFGEYQRSVSKLLDMKINKERISENNGYFGSLDDISETVDMLLILRYKDLRGKELESTPEYDKFNDYVEYFLLNQLDSIRLSKESKSYLISEYGCHIEIVIAANYLINAANYLCRCLGGYNADGLYFSDKMEIERAIEIADITIKRIKHMQY